VWDKVSHHFGHYVSVRTEYLLICIRGACTPDVSTQPDNVLSIEKPRNHSQKPEAFRELIDTLYPHGPRIELFRRGPPYGGMARLGRPARAEAHASKRRE